MLALSSPTQFAYPPEPLGRDYGVYSLARISFAEVTSAEGIGVLGAGVESAGDQTAPGGTATDLLLDLSRQLNSVLAYDGPKYYLWAVGQVVSALKVAAGFARIPLGREDGSPVLIGPGLSAQEHGARLRRDTSSSTIRDLSADLASAVVSGNSEYLGQLADQVRDARTLSEDVVSNGPESARRALAVVSRAAADWTSGAEVKDVQQLAAAIAPARPAEAAQQSRGLLRRLQQLRARGRTLSS